MCHCLQCSVYIWLLAKCMEWINIKIKVVLDGTENHHDNMLSQDTAMNSDPCTGTLRSLNATFVKFIPQIVSELCSSMTLLVHTPVCIPHRSSQILDEWCCRNHPAVLTSHNQIIACLVLWKKKKPLSTSPQWWGMPERHASDCKGGRATLPGRNTWSKWVMSK
jgi:hypothetical protein